MKRLCTIFISLLANVCTVLFALPPQYYSFHNLNNVTQNICVRDITQSEDGMMWFAAESGLYSFDGYHLRKREMVVDGKTVGRDLHVGSFNCIACVEDSLVIGSNNGLLSFNILTGETHKLGYATDETVRSVIVAKGKVIVATSKHVYEQGKKLKVNLNSIMSIKDGGDCLYIGANDGMFRYIYNSKKLVPFETSKQFVTCFGEVSKQSVWFGTPHEVSKINFSTDKERELFSCSIPIAKVMNTDIDGNVLVGTDNGLYIIGADYSVSRTSHDARLSESLAGDAVWSIFRDKGDNIWIGTSNGVSMVKSNCAFTVYRLPYITGLGDGNQIYCLCQDSHQRYWLGGSNGLICIEHMNEAEQTYRWYKMGSKDYPIPHNRVRSVYEDQNKHIWIGGDMGILLYNEENQQFVRCVIPDDENNWVYDIADGPKGMIKVSTYNNVYHIEPNYAAFSINVIKKLGKKADNNTETVLDMSYPLTRSSCCK